MPPALISSQHWAQTLHQLAFFRHPLGRNIAYGRFSIGDALRAAHLIIPMGGMSYVSEWSKLDLGRLAEWPMRLSIYVLRTVNNILI